MSPRDMPIRFILLPWLYFTLGLLGIMVANLFDPIPGAVWKVALGYASLAYWFGLYIVHREIKKLERKQNVQTGNV